MLTAEWKDIVLGIDAPISSASERFNVQRPKRRRYSRVFFEEFGDRFEAMEVTSLGAVTIWTTTKVWCIRTEGGLEKLTYLPRNPPSDREKTT